MGEDRERERKIKRKIAAAVKWVKWVYIEKYDRHSFKYKDQSLQNFTVLRYVLCSIINKNPFS